MKCITSNTKEIARWEHSGSYDTKLCRVFAAKLPTAEILRKKLGSSAALKDDIVHIDRQEGRTDSDEYNSEYLLNSIDRHLRRAGQDQNQASFENS